MSEPSDALKCLRDALLSYPARADGNINASDFVKALEEAIKDCLNDEWEERMGDDL